MKVTEAVKNWIGNFGSNDTEAQDYIRLLVAQMLKLNVQRIINGVSTPISHKDTIDKNDIKSYSINSKINVPIKNYTEKDFFNLISSAGFSLSNIYFTQNSSGKHFSFDSISSSGIRLIGDKRRHTYSFYDIMTNFTISSGSPSPDSETSTVETPIKQTEIIEITNSTIDSEINS